MISRIRVATMLGVLLTLGFGSSASAQNFGGFGGFNGLGGAGFVTPAFGLTGIGIPGAVGGPYWGWPNAGMPGYSGYGYYPPYGGFGYPGYGYGGYGYYGGAYMGLGTPWLMPPPVVNNIGGVMSAIENATGPNHWRR